MRKTAIAIILILAAAAILAAGAVSQDSKPGPMMPGPMREIMPNMMQGSPMNFPGVEIAVTDTPDGVTVSFTTKTGDVAELRRLVRQRVEMMQEMRARMNTPKSGSK